MDKLKQTICSELHIAPDRVVLESAPSGASSKKYYVVSGIAAGRSDEVCTVMQAPVGTLSDFLNMTAFFRKHGIRAPRIFHESRKHEFLIMEKCGDLTLEALVVDASEEQMYRSYVTAIDLLLSIQLSVPEPSCIASTRFFNEEKFAFEFDFHVCQKLITNYFNYPISASERIVLDILFQPVIRELSGQPFVLTHRDFQSSNLLLKGQEMVVIDYQDARMGLALYDLVSLIEDVYVNLSPHLKDRLIAYYIVSARRLRVPIPPDQNFQRIYDLTTIQRKLHDAGAFAFCFETFANVKYLSYITSVLQHALDVMSRYTSFHRPYELLTMISHAHLNKE